MHTQDTALPVATRPVSPPIFWERYQANRTDWFRTPDGFQWFKRQHLSELIAAGALVIISGRVFVVPGVFDAAVIAIGKRLAAARTD